MGRGWFSGQGCGQHWVRAAGPDWQGGVGKGVLQVRTGWHWQRWVECCYWSRGWEGVGLHPEYLPSFWADNGSLTPR